MKLRATVRSVTGRTRHLLGEPNSGEISRLPDPVTVVVLEQDGAFYLLRLDAEGECIADTWHKTLEAAKAQANFEFGINENDWSSS